MLVRSTYRSVAYFTKKNSTQVFKAPVFFDLGFGMNMCVDLGLVFMCVFVIVPRYSHGVVIINVNTACK